MAIRTTVFATGKIYWAKIIGEPRPNYEGTAREWSYEFEPDDITFLKEHRLLDRLKDKYSDQGRGDFLTLRKPELNKDGEKNDPIAIYNENNEPWDDRLIGNGSIVDVKLQIVDWGKGKKKSIYTRAIRVRELVPYTPNEFGAMDAKKSQEQTQEKPKSKAQGSKPEAQRDSFDGFDDDIPF